MAILDGDGQSFPREVPDTAIHEELMILVAFEIWVWGFGSGPGLIDQSWLVVFIRREHASWGENFRFLGVGQQVEQLS